MNLVNADDPSRIPHMSVYRQTRAAPLRRAALHHLHPPAPPSAHPAQSSLCKKIWPRKQSSVGCSSSFVRLAPTRPRRFAHSAVSNVCLVGEGRACFVAALWACEGLWPYDYGWPCMNEYPPAPAPGGHNRGMNGALSRKGCGGNVRISEASNK